MLYFPPNIVPTTYTFRNGKKKFSQRANLAKYLNDTSCIENGFTIMSNGLRASDAKFANDTHKHYMYMIRWYSVGRIGRKNTNKKQKHETKGANTCSEKCNFELPVFHNVVTGRLYVCANVGGNFQHSGHNFVPREHTKDSCNNIPRPSLDLAINLIERNVPNSIVNVIFDVQSGRLLTSDSLKQLRNVVLNKKQQKTKTKVPLIALKE